MEEQQQTTTQSASKSSMGKFAIPAVIVVIIAVAAIAFFMNSQGNSGANQNATPTSMQTQESQPTDVMAKYKDGTYTTVGEYTTPGGQREIGVTITIANGVITDSVFEGKAEDKASVRFQKEFGDNYTSLVVGKNIDEVQLTKVSGSSLTPMGFNDAIQKIKSQASAS